MQPQAPQDTPPDLEKLRADLRRSGPEGRRGREDAVIELLSLADTAAHRLLLDVLAGGDDPDGLARFVLEQSGRSLANRRNDVFYPAGEKRAQQAPLRRSYGLAFLRQYASAAPELRTRARTALLGMEEADLAALFGEILRGAVDSDRVAACAAIADLQSLTYAPLLAACLSDPKLGPIARECLSLLTFRSDGFQDEAAFEKWRVEQGNVTYLELAERSARDALRRAREHRAADEAEILRLQQHLVAAWARIPEVPWQNIQRLLQEDRPPGSRQQCLIQLRDVLGGSDRPAAGPEAERAALLDYLAQRMKAGAPEAEYPLLLEVSAYLVDPNQAEPKARVVEALVKGLASPTPAVRLAALRGLRRHPSPENRHAVVSLLTDARVQEDPDQLAAVLGTLQAKGWNAPQPGAVDSQIWVASLQRVIANRNLKKDLRDAALLALQLRDRNGLPVPGAFQALVELVADAELDAELREKSLMAMPPHVTPPAAAAATHWDRYVALLLQCLTDAKDRVRQRAAVLLQQPPPSPTPEKRAEADAEILRAVDRRLLEEPDASTFRALVECLRRRFNPERDPTPVLMPLIRALEEIAQKPGNQTLAFRREPIVHALTAFVVVNGVLPAHWVRALEALAVLGDRASMRFVLEKQANYIGGGAPADATGLEIYRSAQRMVIRAAALKPPGEPWSALTDEARDVVRAFAVLDQPGANGAGATEPAVPGDLALRLEVLNATGQYQRAVDLARAHLQQGRAADDGLRGRIARHAAEALRQLKQPLEAWKLLESVPAAAGENGGPRLREELARDLVQAGNPADALPLIEPLLQQTQRADPAYASRLLLWAEAVHAAKPERTAEVLDQLHAERGRFVGEQVVAELRDRYQALLKKLQG